MKLSPILIQALGLQPLPAAVDTPRYEGFVQEVSQSLQVWGLLDAGGWISLPLGDGAACLPVWSQPHDARAFARGPWGACAVGAIDVPDFLDHWLPAMDSLGVLVAVQPDDAGTLAPMPARVLAWHLQVRCINFSLRGLDGPADPAPHPSPGET